MLLKGKKAVVTGSRRGIGKAVLRSFAENGADVFAHARKRTEEFERECKSLQERFSVRITPVYFDARQSAEMKKAVRDITKVSKEIDILVNNMGTVDDVKLFHMTTVEEMKAEFDVNFFAQMEFTQYISRLMLRRKTGSIVNISSCAGLDGTPGMLQYVSAKAALIGATKRLAIELGSANIRVNAVAPGLTDTEMGGRISEELERKTLEHLIIKRKARPEEIADTVLFLASDMSAFITGQTIRVDGGSE